MSNWDLSGERANAARRAMLAGGMTRGKIAEVVGLSDTEPFDPRDPKAAINRRISIVVLSSQTLKKPYNTQSYAYRGAS